MATASPNGSDSLDSSWRTALIWGAQRVVTVAIAMGATYLGGCFLALVVYTSAFPPATSVQVQRNIEAAFSGGDPVRRYEPIPLSRIDGALPLAVVTGEDSRFFLPRGIDWKEVEKAIQTYRDGGELRGLRAPHSSSSRTSF